jgi:hypothetical protein
MRQGTFITVRVDQALSSDYNQPGDAFTATLVKPLVVDGVVVARAGQTVAGRVTESQKAGHVQGVSRLGIQMTELTLADGQQVPVQCQFINRTGPTSVGQDVGVVAGTSALGAATGAIADGGFGAGVGAAAGAVVGLIGVLSTRGHATVIYPESVLTFRIEAPVTVSTMRAPQAFHYVSPDDYERPAAGPGPGPGPTYAQVRSAPVAPYAPYPYYPTAPYYYAPSYYPYYWGPGFSFYFGPGYYYRGYYGHPYYYGGGRYYYGGHAYHR